jgi:hypothetical protein
MRASRASLLTILPLIGVLAVATPRQAPAQVSINLRLGPPVVVTNYAPDVYGNWRTDYMSWHPVTVYYYEGQWYTRPIRQARPVVVYQYRNQYFLPPRDAGWVNQDRRYDYRRRPVDDDYNHAIAAPPRTDRAAAPPRKDRGRHRGPPAH